MVYNFVFANKTSVGAPPVGLAVLIVFFLEVGFYFGCDCCFYSSLWWRYFQKPAAAMPAFVFALMKFETLIV